MERQTSKKEGLNLGRFYPLAADRDGNFFRIGEVFWNEMITR